MAFQQVAAFVRCVVIQTFRGDDRACALLRLAGLRLPDLRLGPGDQIDSGVISITYDDPGSTDIRKRIRYAVEDRRGDIVWLIDCRQTFIRARQLQQRLALIFVDRLIQ